MTTTINLIVALVGVLHIVFAYMEMVLWTKPFGLKAFRQSKEQARASAKLAQNQGLYNLFLAAGLLWSLLHPAPDVGVQLQIFFLGCVVVAGLFGGWTVSKNIALIQALPAAIGLGLIALM